ncbi:lipase [Nocardia stercoris]|uniref:Lipase n=2 Tax=Nocardia stercoris TaxID=2483361 RepID=A0A3M2L7N0_9NOCA|nr:lipase [Nocardia stercoris]
MPRDPHATRRTTTRLLGAAVTAAVLAAAPTWTATAAPITGPHKTAAYDPFYDAPDLSGSAPGDILRSQPFPLTLAVPGPGGQLPGNATRIMYRSNDTNDAPNAVTGTYLEPAAPWTGPGPRPLVAVAPGTQGQGSQCAPSKTLGELVHYTFPFDIWVTSYEVLTAYTFLSQGMAVVMTDYAGFTNGGVHDYVNRLSGAHAVLDSVRAAEALTGTHPPTAIVGYSEGGNAAAAAAELQSRYAPDIDLVGSYVGAPPADLRAVLDQSAVIDGPLPGIVGGLAPGLVGYVLNGMEADYPDVRPAIDSALTPDGRQMLAAAAGSCVAELGLRTMLRPIDSYTDGRESVDQMIERSPELAARVDEQRIGGLDPAAPVLIAAGTADDVIPYSQVRQLAADWCGHGAIVQLDRTAWLPPLFPGTAIGHGLEFAPAIGDAAAWVRDRLAGIPAPDNCAALP